MKFEKFGNLEPWVWKFANLEISWKFGNGGFKTEQRWILGGGGEQIYIYIYTYVHMYMYIFTDNILQRACVCIQLYMHVCANGNVCMCLCLSVCLSVCLYVCMYVCMYVC